MGQYQPNPGMMQGTPYIQQQVQQQQAPQQQMYNPGQMATGSYIGNQMMGNSTK